MSALLPIGEIDDVVVWKMSKFADGRGYLAKSFSQKDVELLPESFVTVEHFFTNSKKNVFRGMHLQGVPHELSKIVCLVNGKAIDYLFDTRKNSRTFGFLQVIELDAAEPCSIFIPPGVAHGYLVLEDNTIFSYRMNGAFCKNCDTGFNLSKLVDQISFKHSQLIFSDRDKSLVDFSEFNFLSNCV
jgi:dTDP-4-dehydrorhamnose 3,5-epimerase